MDFMDKITYVTFLWDDTMVLGEDPWNDTTDYELEPSCIPVCGILLKETKKHLLLGLCSRTVAQWETPSSFQSRQLPS